METTIFISLRMISQNILNTLCQRRWLIGSLIKFQDSLKNNNQIRLDLCLMMISFVKSIYNEGFILCEEDKTTL